MDNQLTLKCPICGHILLGTKHDPVLGWEYSKGWNISCPDCRAPMVVDDEPEIIEDIDDYCDLCGERTYIHYVMPAKKGWIEVCGTCHDKMEQGTINEYPKKPCYPIKVGASDET